MNSSQSINEKISKQSTGSQPFSMGKFKVSGFLSPKNNSVQTEKFQNDNFSIGSNNLNKMNFQKNKMTNSKQFSNFNTSSNIKKNYINNNQKTSIKMKFVNVNGIENGKEKIGQDSVLINKFKIKSEIFYVFGVFDGHGKHGHHVSQYVKKNMIPAIKYFLKKQFSQKQANIKHVLRNACQYINMKISSISQKFTKKNGSHSDILGSSNFSIANESNFDATLSGSTCSLVLLYNGKIYSLSLGDSKGILGMLHPSNQLIPYNISTEHKASSKSEQKRILASNGFLHPLRDKDGNDAGPVRIWDSSHKYPGLMVSRSFGDLLGKKCGVSGEPDIIEMELKNKHKCLILASDGFWDVHSSLEALNGMYSQTNREMEDIGQVLVDMTKKTLSLWKSNFGRIHRDDVSIVLVYFNH